MEDAIDSAIRILLAEIKSGTNCDADLKFSQSILNLAHAKITLADVKNVKNRS